MSLCQTYRRWASLSLVLAVILIVAPIAAYAQAQQAPQAPSPQSNDATPKEELFLGYQWLNPGGSIPDGSTPPQAINLPSVPQGAAASLAYNFNKWGSLEGDWGINGYRYATINTGMVGPKADLPRRRSELLCPCLGRLRAHVRAHSRLLQRRGCRIGRRHGPKDMEAAYAAFI